MYFLYLQFDVEALQQDLYHDAKQLACVSVTEEDRILRVKTEEDKYYNYLGNGIDAIPSLYNVKDYVVARRELYVEFDLIYFLTGYDMIVPGDGGWDRGYRGFAFVGSACLDTREQLGEDTPNSFIGIRTMAHEMAHT
ncbi:hypothetical protein MTO96_036572 [Rhipicephalus appendiculatus]